MNLYQYRKQMEELEKDTLERCVLRPNSKKLKVVLERVGAV